MKRSFALFFLLLGPAACRRKTAPLLAPGDALYASASGDLRLEIPKDWRVLENQGGGQRVSFFGPPDGPKPYSDSIGVYFYGPGTDFPTPEDYARAQSLSAREATPLSPFSWKGRPAQQMTVTRLAPSLHHVAPPQSRVDRCVIIPAAGGFFVLVHSAPQDSAREQAAVFDRVLQSLEISSIGG